MGPVKYGCPYEEEEGAHSRGLPTGLEQVAPALLQESYICRLYYELQSKLYLCTCNKLISYTTIQL